jgi:hypothetical protein
MTNLRGECFQSLLRSVQYCPCATGAHIQITIIGYNFALCCCCVDMCVCALENDRVACRSYRVAVGDNWIMNLN